MVRSHLIVIPESRMKAKILGDRNWVIEELHAQVPIKSAECCSALEAFWENPSASMDSILFILRE